MTAADLASRLGLKKAKKGYRGRCPHCDYPGTFSIADGREGRTLVYCASCQDEDGIFDTLQRITDGTFVPVRRVEREQTEAEARERKQERARQLWVCSARAVGSPVEPYLYGRGLHHLAFCPEIRFLGDCPHPADKVRRPAMVARVLDVDGAPVAVHRTYLDTATNRKAAIDPPRASLGPIWGGSVRLQPWTGTEEALIVAEGIETAGSAALLMDLPAWAALSAGNLAKGLQLPLSVERVIVAGDRDGPGSRAANEAAARWVGEGRKVRIAWPDGGNDFNDVLMRGRSDG